MKVKVAHSCSTLCNPMDYTVHGILQASILEWVAFPFSRASSQPRDWTQVSRIAGGFFTSWATREAWKRGEDDKAESGRIFLGRHGGCGTFQSKVTAQEKALGKYGRCMEAVQHGRVRDVQRERAWSLPGCLALSLMGNHMITLSRVSE